MRSASTKLSGCSSQPLSRLVLNKQTNDSGRFFSAASCPSSLLLTKKRKDIFSAKSVGGRHAARHIQRRKIKAKEFI